MARVAIVTGGSRGIGEAISLKLKEQGVTVIANYGGNDEKARAFTDRPVRMLGASVVTDRFRIEDRADPLRLAAATRSVHDAFRRANVHRSDIGFFEVHDAFSIMSALILEATGFAEPGQG